MHDDVVVVGFRERRQDDPSTLRRGRFPEMDPNETTVTCTVCGYWGIVSDTTPVKKAVHPETETSLVCGECARSEQGLYEKYEVTKDGEPVENCFVLEPESDSAAREALIRYAEATDDEALADDLREWVTKLCTRGETDA